MDSFKERRKALEILVQHSVLYCEKHKSNVNKRQFFKSRCYMGRNRMANKCPYLQFIDYNPDGGCRK